MTNGDVVSMMLAGVALMLAASISVLMVTSARRRARVASPAAAPLAAAPLAVRLTQSTGTDLAYWWRFDTADEAPPIAIDIFSFRDRGAQRAGPWQHELMDAELLVTPGEPTYLRAPTTATGPTAYDVSVGWTIREPDGDIRDSAIMTVEAEHFA